MVYKDFDLVGDILVKIDTWMPILEVPFLLFLFFS
jgi:hypothetical protein